MLNRETGKGVALPPIGEESISFRQFFSGRTIANVQIIIMALS